MTLKRTPGAILVLVAIVATVAIGAAVGIGIIASDVLGPAGRPRAGR